MTTNSITVRRLLLVVVAFVVALTALAPQAQAQGAEDPGYESSPALLDTDLVALRSGLLELRASLNADTMRWLSLFNRELVPLANAIEALESDVDALLVTIDGPMTADQYRLALVQLNDGVESWRIVAQELSPYWHTSVAEWERAWAEVVVEWEQAWSTAVADWEQRWNSRAAEAEAEWTAAVTRWEQAWVDAAGEWQSEWERAATQWETEWEEAVEEAETEWNTAAQQWEDSWEEAATQWKTAWEQAIAGRADRRGD